MTKISSPPDVTPEAVTYWLRQDLRVTPKTRLGPLPAAVHPASRMGDPESALSGNLFPSGNGKHAPCMRPRATRHAGVAADM